MSDPTYPAERHVKVPEDWFTENDFQNVGGNEVLGVPQGGIFHLVPEQGGGGATSHTKTNFLPAGILIGVAQDNDTDATYAVINGWLWGETILELDTYRLAIGVVHPLRFAGFVFNNTSARSIRFLGES